MRVIINLFNIVSDNEVTPYSLFINSIVHSIALERPDDEFIIFNSSDKMINHYLPNVKCHLIKQKKQNAVSALQYHRMVLPAMINKIMPDMIIEANGLCFNTSKYYQVVLMDETTLINQYKLIHKLFFSRSLTYASKIISFTENGKLYSRKYQPSRLAKVLKFHYAASNHFFVHTDVELQKVRDSNADARPYFLFYCDSLNYELWEEVFKAFSLFKKWQNSFMKLLVINYSYSHVIELKLANYKHKDDVVMINNPDEHFSARLIAAAYAMIYPAKLNYIPLPVLQSIQCNTPVVVCKSVTEVANNDKAFYWTEDPEPQSLSKQMILSYKDEVFRKEVIEQAKEVGKNYSFKQLTDQFIELMDGVNK